MKNIIDELLYDIARERDLEHQSLLIKDCAKKLNNLDKKKKTYPLPKNIFISSGIVPSAYFEIALPQHMVKIEFISKSGDLVDYSFKTFPSGDRFLVKVDGIPSLLIKKVNFGPLNWDNNVPAKTILYVWEPGHKSLFDINAWYTTHPYAQWLRHPLK